MADIFISYKREDLALAKVLADHLQKEGWSVWWDHEIPSGKDYDIVIEKELENCKCAIVLWTPVSIQSRNVKDEANVALRKNKLLPVIVGNVQPPLGFRMIQGVVWNDNNRVEDNELADLKKQVANMFTASTGETAPIYKQPAKRSFKKIWLIGACIIGVIVLLLIFRGGGNDQPKQKTTGEKTAEEYAEIGANLANNNKDYDGSIENFDKAIALDSTFAYAYFGRGSTYNLKGMQTRAIEDLLKSIELEYFEAYGNLGWTYFDVGEYESAIEYFDLDCQRDPNALSEAGAAMSYFVLNNADSAKARYDKAIELDARLNGNFEALTSDYNFNERQVRTLKSLYSTLYKVSGD